MTQELISIKGSKNGLIIYFNPYHELEELKKCLINKFEATKGFFQGAHFFLKSQNGEITIEQERELETICKKYGLIPTPSKDKSDNTKPPANKNENCQLETSGILPSELQEKNNLIQGNIRNGQKKFFEGNVILLGDVNPGGQIAATGNIIILGTLKGIAHSGINGNKDSIILASDFRPHQIRIAQTVARNPDVNPLPTKTPEIARLVDNTILIEKYSVKKLSKIV